jgi:hypothetical protein
MEDFNTPIYAQAKIEYTKQLKDVLINPMYNKMYFLYQESKEKYANSTDISIFNIFRNIIQDIPKWNNDIIENELKNIIDSSRCDWLEDLVTAVFISHTKVLASIGNNKYNKKINLTIPVLTNFIHKCYINFAREIWKNPFLFDENQSSSDYQGNIKIIEDLIKESIDITIRKSLPVKEILKEHLESNVNEDEEDDEDEIEDEKEKTKNLQKILMSEIINLRRDKNNAIDNYQNNVDSNDNEETYFDDHVDENMIKKNTEKIEINDILNENKPENNIEPIYDNPNILDRESIDDSIVSVEEKLNGYKNVLNSNNLNNINEEPVNDVKITDEPVNYVKIVDEPVNDVKIVDEPVNDVKIVDEPVNEPVNDVKIVDEPVNDVKIVDEPVNDVKIVDEPVNDVKITDEPDEPIYDVKITDESSNDVKIISDNNNNNSNIIQKIEETLSNPEVKTIQTGKNLNDETMTLDNFLDDVDNMVSNKEYTLFNDANDI